MEMVLEIILIDDLEEEEYLEMLEGNIYEHFDAYMALVKSKLEASGFKVKKIDLTK